MPQLSWDTAPNARRYEFGISRGVLYPHEGAGVAWNGLVSVSQENEAAESSDYHLDGVKYLSTQSPRGFSAVVSAFSAPAEFAPYVGQKSMLPGIILDKQPKKRFGFSYRTEVGGVQSYKIHLIYNILAVPTTQEYTTVGGAVVAPIRGWRFNTTPERLVGRRPTAHLVADSRRVPPILLAELEDILYGTAETTARLPSGSELLQMFGGVPS